MFLSFGEKWSDQAAYDAELGKYANLYISQGWKGNVDAKLFVYSLRERYSELFEVLLDSQTDVERKTDDEDDDESSPATSDQRPEYNPSDMWALKYLNLMSIRDLTDALDSDASSLITIKNVNDFTRARPKDWR